MAKATAKNELAATFAALKAVLKKHAKRLVVLADSATGYTLVCKSIAKYNQQPLYFGGARIGKRYVSYYLFWVYASPPLLKGMSKGLAARMQGKSCFNFKRPEPELFAELDALTGACLASLAAKGLLKAGAVFDYKADA